MILLYHKIFPEAQGQWWVTPDTMRNQLLDLQGRYQFVYLDDYIIGSKDQCVVTFDGIYTNVLKYAAPLLKELGIPFELFLSGDHVGLGNDFDVGEPPAQFCNAAELRRLRDFGGRLQWHTRSHARLFGLDQGALAHELDIPANLRELDPSGYTWFAYPHGDCDETALKVVRERFKGAVSVVQGNDHDRHLLNRVIVEETTCFRHSKITVIVPSYNYGAFLSDAVESVLRQTRPPDEIIISDDCSTDNTQEVGEYYARRFPKLVRYRRNTTNLGIVEHFNAAVEEAKGDYICFLGADNRLCSNYVEETSGILDRDSKCGVAYTDYHLFGPRAALVHLNFPEEWRMSPRDGFYGIRFPEFSQKTFDQRNFIHGSSMYRKSCFEAVNGYRRDPGDPEDYAFFKKILLKGWAARKAVNTFLEYRQHSSSQADFVFAAAAQLRFYKYRVTELEIHARAVGEQLEEFRRSLETVNRQNRSLTEENGILRDQIVLLGSESVLDHPVLFRKILDSIGYFESHVSWKSFFKMWVRSGLAFLRGARRRL